MIELVRIDERLIHGQVAVSWTKTLKITHIVVADDEVVTQEMQVTALKMACPPEIKLAVCSLEQAVGVLNDPRLADKRVMVVVKRPKDALRLVEGVPAIGAVNVGNTGYLGNTEGTREVALHVRLSDADLDCLKEIQKRVPVDIQVVPDAAKKPLKSILEGS